MNIKAVFITVDNQVVEYQQKHKDLAFKFCYFPRLVSGPLLLIGSPRLRLHQELLEAGNQHSLINIDLTVDQHGFHCGTVQSHKDFRCIDWTSLGYPQCCTPDIDMRILLSQVLLGTDPEEKDSGTAWMFPK